MYSTPLVPTWLRTAFDKCLSKYQSSNTERSSKITIIFALYILGEYCNSFIIYIIYLYDIVCADKESEIKLQRCYQYYDIFYHLGNDMTCIGIIDKLNSTYK